MLTMEVHNIFFCTLLITMVLFVSNNCNGLRNVNKFKKYISIVEEKHIDFLMLQETFWDTNFVSDNCHLYDGKIFHSHGVNNRQGVAILVSKRFKSNVEEVFKDNEGRLLHIKLEINNVIFNVLNIYAHNIVTDRTQFFQFIDGYLQNFDNLILFGDWNTTLSKLDRGSKSEHKEDACYRVLNNVMENNNVYDLWRARNCNNLVYSRKRVCNNILQQSRIDYILIDRNLSNFVQCIRYYDTSLSDHSFVEMKYNFDDVEKGPGLWILNNTLLFNEEYVAQINKIIDDEKKCMLYDTETLIWWDNLKYKIKKFSQVFSKRIAKEKNSEYYCLQNKIQKLSQRIGNGENINIAQYESLKLELSILEEEKCKGAILRSKAYWATESDKCTKYFLNLEKYKQERNCIKELVNDKNEIISDTEELLELQYDFYRKLYSCVQTDDNAVEEILKNIPVSVCDDDVNMCDEDITIDEIYFALSKMSKNKSPGSDGLTTEFYCKCFNSLKDILLKLYNDVEKNSTLSRSMRSGVISLIYKNKGDKKDLKNYRPISLLQVDYKILARIMSNRFKNVLCKIVSNCQTCCISGRDIADTIASLRDVIDLIECDDIEVYVVKFDQEKAFDRVSHKYLLQVLKKFGFGERFVHWIEIFYTDIQSSVKCNGFLTKYFKIKNGIRQGCPISALLYVLSAEPLQYAVRNNEYIKGIHIPGCNETALIFQHADDTTLTVNDKKSIQETLSVFDMYGRASGSKINKLKSEIMCLGSGHLNEDEMRQLELQFCKNSMKVLGVYLGTNKEECENKNWKEKISKIRALTGLWKKRQLTLSGRMTVISSLMVSRIWYTIAVCSIPKWAMDEIKQLCIEFLWSSGAHLINYRTIIGVKECGGLNFPDIYLKMLSFRLKFLGRYLNPDCSLLWKNTLTYFLRKVHDMNMDTGVLFMLLDKKGLLKLPIVYQEMVEAWQFIKSNVNMEMRTVDIFNQPIFCNSEINLKGKLQLWENFILAGLVKVKDISYEVIPGFLPFQAIFDIVQEVVPDINYEILSEQYDHILQNIPEMWKNTVTQNSFPINSDDTPSVCLEYNNKVINFESCKTKHFYDVLVEKCFIKPNVYDYWSEQCNIGELCFKILWKQVHCYWKTPDCIDLDFKILHNRIFTNVKLHKCGLVNSDLCMNCGKEKEDLIHLFLNCETLTDLHQYIHQLLCELFVKSQIDILNFYGYKRIFLLGIVGKQKGVNSNFTNFMLSVGRLCIMKARQMKKNNVTVNLKEYFKYTLKHYVTYFYTYAKYTNKYKMFDKFFLVENSIVLASDDILIFNL